MALSGSGSALGLEASRPRSSSVPLVKRVSEPTDARGSQRDPSFFTPRDLEVALGMEDEESEGSLQEQGPGEARVQLVQGEQEWRDGCVYRGQFGLQTKLGFGEFSWPTGETYQGHFYHDHLHGLGTYTWPGGTSFTGTFYLSRREGLGSLSLKSRLFQGLYKADHRFGPGVETYPDGSQDVGLWAHEHLIKLCFQMPGSFSLLSFPELAHCLQNASSRLSLSEEEVMEWGLDECQDPFFYEYKKFLLNDDIVLPPDMPTYSTDNGHLPMTSSLRKDLEAQLFVDDIPPFVEDGEPWLITNETPLMVRIQKQAYRFRNKKHFTSWHLDAIMQGDRSSFSNHGPRERLSRELILKAESGDYDWIYGVLRDNLVSADVADAKGYTVLAAAAVYSHMRVISLLLDSGADVNKLSDEGLSVLSMCFLLYYPTETFKVNIAERTGPEHQEVTVRTPVPLSTHFLPAEDTMRPLEQEEQAPCQDQEEPALVAPNLEAEATVPVFFRMSRESGRPPPGQVLDEGLARADKGSSNTTFDSNVCVQNFPINFSPEFLERTAQLPGLLRAPAGGTHTSDRGALQRTTLSMTERRRRWQTIQLLLHRGADPNLCRVPMQVLFFAVKAADVDGVKLLLESGARTDIRFPPQLRSLTPLHIAAALPGQEGVQITELLLHAITDVDAQAADQDEVYGAHQMEQMPPSSLKLNNEPGPPSTYYTPCPPVPEGGRTPLHVACEREDDSKGVKDIVRLLLSHGANPNMLWSGHSPLSLCITSNKDSIVRELLAHGADPNLPLTNDLGNALCLACDLHFDHHRGVDHRLTLIDRLIHHGANILSPVTLTQGDKVAVGTAVDYGYFKFFQDRKIAHCAFHTLLPAERETYLARKRLLEYMGFQLRRAVLAVESQWDPQQLSLSKTAELAPPNRLMRKSVGGLKSEEMEEAEEIPFFKFCFQCGRSVGVRLTPCTRCYGILTCSKLCKTRAWNEYHKRDCGANTAQRKRLMTLNFQVRQPISKVYQRVRYSQLQ
ncbi:ankyrin repeat and MYND domain-containing protein 1 [Tenrec ecaudatus]|uniref:ankyrin repeat and MYND domain-containing protein 1 n=1 Tax=Tenrec ecaudatus TaxID=94439 RepID=UPI003F598909